jgi:hypothetical protein
MLLTCNEGEEIDAEYGEDLHLGLLVHTGVHRDSVVQQQRGPANLPKQRTLCTGGVFLCTCALYGAVDF